MNLTLAFFSFLFASAGKPRAKAWLALRKLSFAHMGKTIKRTRKVPEKVAE